MKKESGFRTGLPFAQNDIGDGSALSPLTNRSVMPFNNVKDILSILNGEPYQMPGGGGSWSPGEDVSTSYRGDTADNYKREVRDLDIIRKMVNIAPMEHELWQVVVPGGKINFRSLPAAQRHVEKLKNAGKPFTKIERMKQVAQMNNVGLIGDSIEKTYKIESVDWSVGIKEAGAGFCVAPGYFVTCAHVIKSYNKLKDNSLDLSNVAISLVRGNRNYPATVVAFDLPLDIAILKSDAPSEVFELDYSVDVGEEIFAIGSPHGYENHVSEGIVGSLDRTVYFYDDAPKFTFLDVEVLSGNSGGPAVKLSNGKIVAMVTLVLSAEGTSGGLNAGLPVSYIEEFCVNNIPGYRDKT